MEAVGLWAATEATAAGRAMAETAVAVARAAEVRAEGAAVGVQTVVVVAKEAKEATAAELVEKERVAALKAAVGGKEAEEEAAVALAEVAALMVAAVGVAAVGASSCIPDGCRTPPSHPVPRSSP